MSAACYFVAATWALCAMISPVLAMTFKLLLSRNLFWSPLRQLAEISLSCLLVALPCGCDTHLRTDMTGTSHSCRASLSPPWRGNNVFVCDLRFTPGVQNHPRLSQPLLLRLSQLLHAARPLRQRAPQLQRWRLSPERQPSQPFLLPVRLQHALFLFLASSSGRRSEFRTILSAPVDSARKVKACPCDP